MPYAFGLYGYIRHSIPAACNLAFLAAARSLEIVNFMRSQAVLTSDFSWANVQATQSPRRLHRRFLHGHSSWQSAFWRIRILLENGQ
jgi:hypothetical protein